MVKATNTGADCAKSASYSVTVYTTRADLDLIAPEWRRLALTRPRNGLCTTYEWYRAWLDNVYPSATPFVICVRAKTGEVIGLAPFCEKPFRDLGFRIRAVAFGGRELVSGDYLDVLAYPEFRQTVLDAIMTMLAADDHSLVCFEELLLNGDTHIAVERWAESHNLAIRRQELRGCPYVTLPQDFDSYLTKVSSKFRKRFRASSRDILVKNGYEVVVCSQEAEIKAGLNTLIDLHLARWNAIGYPGTLGSPGMRQFLLSFCTNPPSGGDRRLYLLKRGDDVAAALLVFWFGSTAYYYQSGWKPNSDVAKFSPSTLLIGCAIEGAIAGGMTYFDFLRGREEYKYNWAREEACTATILVARGKTGRAYLTFASLKDAIKAVIRLGKI